MFRAMIFAAGLGTRLRPLTNDRPKALVEIEGIPLLDLQLRRLRHFGFEEVVVNVHHFAELMVQHLAAHDYGIKIHVSDERAQLLDTGGGLWFARHFFEGDAPVFICNVDVLSSLDPRELIARHQREGALATLSLRERLTDRYLVFDGKMRLCGWENRKSGETKGLIPKDGKAFAFSGQHVISPRLFAEIQQRGAFSIIDTYLELSPKGSILGVLDESEVWMDVGKPKELADAAECLRKLEWV